MNEFDYTLERGEVHPSSHMALHYIKKIPPLALLEYANAIGESALDGNRTAQICLATLRRLENKEAVSDRYLLGLAWFLRDLDDLNGIGENG